LSIKVTADGIVTQVVEFEYSPVFNEQKDAVKACYSTASCGEVVWPAPTSTL
jgi:hypothetical protein